MKIKLSLIVALLFCLLTAPVFAAVVDDLYTIRLKVEDQTTRLRLASFKKALAEVLVKVSGSDELLSDAALKRSLNNSTRYVRQFHYEREKLAEDAVEEGAIILSVDFDEKRVEALLRSKGYPVWGRVRPSVLIVMSRQLNKKYELVTEEALPELIQTMDELSHKHGLPTQFPLLDIEDRAVLNFKESALDNIDAINSLGIRYQSDVVLVGELIGISGQGWKGVWQSQFSGRLFQWEDRASTKEEVMSKAVVRLAKVLAQEYALGSVADSTHLVELQVDNIATLEGYLSVVRYLSSLAVVEKTQVKSLKEDNVVFSLLLRNSPDELQRLIELGDVIEQIDLPVIDVTAETFEEGLPQEVLSLTYRRL